MFELSIKSRILFYDFVLEFVLFMKSNEQPFSILSTPLNLQNIILEFFCFIKYKI